LADEIGGDLWLNGADGFEVSRLTAGFACAAWGFGRAIVARRADFEAAVAAFRLAGGDGSLHCIGSGFCDFGVFVSFVRRFGSHGVDGSAGLNLLGLLL